MELQAFLTKQDTYNTAIEQRLEAELQRVVSLEEHVRDCRKGTFCANTTDSCIVTCDIFPYQSYMRVYIFTKTYQTLAYAKVWLLAAAILTCGRNPLFDSKVDTPKTLGTKASSPLHLQYYTYRLYKYLFYVNMIFSTLEYPTII